MLVLALCVVGALLAAWLYRELRHDDAFITFRYARNLAVGRGFVFNPGERVLGTTSPLLTLTLAAVYAAFGDVLETAAVVLGALSLGIQAWVIHRLLRSALPTTAILLCAYTLSGIAGSHTWLALETNSAVALTLAALWAHFSGRAVLCGVLLGLAVLARYDAVLMGAAIVAWAWMQRRPPAWRSLGIALLVAMPWFVFATWYFGTPLPRSLGAKISISDPGAYFASYANLFVAFEPFSRLPPWLRHVLAWSCLLSGVVFALRRCRVLALLVGHALALWVAYAMIGPPASQHWHMLPVTLVLRLTMAVGVLGWIEVRMPPKTIARAALPAVGLCYLLLLGVGLWGDSQTIGSSFWLGERHRRYTIVADWLNAHVRPGARLMPAEVGTLGYLTDLIMVDPFGILHRSNDWPRTMRLESFMALVVRHDPDLVLFGAPFQARAFAAYAPARRYDVVKIFPWLRPWSTLVVRSERRASILSERPRGPTDR